MAADSSHDDAFEDLADTMAFVACLSCVGLECQGFAVSSILTRCAKISSAGRRDIRGSSSTFTFYHCMPLGPSPSGHVAPRVDCS